MNPWTAITGFLRRSHRILAADEAYRIATATRTNKAWQPSSFGGDSATYTSVELGLSRIRDLVRNNPQFVRARGTLTDLIVGQGIQAYCSPFSFDFDVSALLNRSGDEDSLEVPPELAGELQYAWESDRYFALWADDPQQCDVEGKLSFWDMQRAAFGDMVEVGDALFLMVQRQVRRDRLIPLSLQLLEREQLDRTKDCPAAPGQNKIVNGIELDGENRPVAYWLYDAHPDDTSYASSSGSRRIPAERVLHCFVPFRPSMHVGFSWFRAMAATARDRHWLLSSELTKAAIGALVTLVHYKDDPEGSGPSLADGEDTTDASGNEIVKLGEAISMRASSRDKIELFQTNTPSQTLTQFIDTIDHDQAAGVELSHLRYTGRWAGLSYTAGRGAQLDDEMHARPLKNFWGRVLVVPIRKLVNAQCVGLGHVKSITAAEFRRDPNRYQNFWCIGPGREQLDPVNETESSLAKLRSGMSTLQIENGNRGLHWLQVLLQMRREMLVARMFGLKLDYSKGQGGQTKSTTTDSAAATQDAGGPGGSGNSPGNSESSNGRTQPARTGRNGRR